MEFFPKGRQTSEFGSVFHVVEVFVKLIQVWEVLGLIAERNTVSFFLSESCAAFVALLDVS